VPVPNNTWAWLLNPDKSMHGVSLVVTGTGAFSFAGVAPGAYFVRVVPPAHMLNLAPSPIRPVFITATVGTLNLPPLALTTPSVTGTSMCRAAGTKCNGESFCRAAVSGNRPTVNGNFVIGGLPTGTCTLRAEPLPDDASGLRGPSSRSCRVRRTM
jgi:hypothetical protein